MDLDSSDSDVLMFGGELPETIVTVSGDYRTAPLKVKLSYVDSFFYESTTMHFLPAILILTAGGLIASISALPFVAYEGFLPSLEWDFTCILRATAFAIVYLEAWVLCFRRIYWWCIPYITDTQDVRFPDPEDFPGVSLFKKLSGFFLAFTYAGLYAWKWYALTDILLSRLAIPMFLISTTLVFYNLIVRQLSNSIGTRINNRQRKVLLRAAKIGYFNSTRDSIVAETVVDHLRRQNCSAFSLMIGVHNNYLFTDKDDELLKVYEEDFYDPYEYIRVSGFNICLGVALIALWLTMIEDYGHAIATTAPLNEEGYLWFVSIICFVISCFYLLCSYNLAHRALRSIHSFVRCKESLQLIKGFAYKFPAFGMGILIASTRMNSSYAIFGRLAAKYALPHSLGFTLIYLGVGIVFLLDMVTATQLLHHAIQSLLTLGNWELCSKCSCGRRFENWMLVRYYHLKAKNLIREASEDVLNRLTLHVACRSLRA